VTVVCGNVTVTYVVVQLVLHVMLCLFVNCLYSFDVVLLELETGIMC